jgi:hypothetical protein
MVFIIKTQLVYAGSGELRLETRNYSHDNESSTIDDQNALFAEFNHETEWMKLNVFSRQDSVDSSRNFIKPTDLYLYKNWENFNLKLGHQVLTIGQLELFHGGDIFNARNFDSSPDRFEKFGELGPYFNWSNENWDITLAQILVLEKPLLPSSQNRSGPLVVFPDPEYVSDQNELSPQPDTPPLIFLTRYRGNILDLEMSYMKIPDRSIPLLIVDENFNPLNSFLTVEQTGISLTKNIDDWLMKVDYFYKNYEDHSMETLNGINPITFEPLVENITIKDHSVRALGLEYQKTYANEHVGTFLLEYQILEGIQKDERKMYTLMQNDLGLGYRHSFNDMNSQEITFISFIDQDTANEFLMQISYNRRLEENWKLLIGLRSIEAPEKDDNPLNRENYIGLTGIRDGDHLFSSLSYFF